MKLLDTLLQMSERKFRLKWLEINIFGVKYDTFFYNIENRNCPTI